MMVLVLVLRYTITKLRDLGFGQILPLDHNIYLHKVTGVVIFFMAWSHTIMHLINFGKTLPKLLYHVSNAFYYNRC